MSLTRFEIEPQECSNMKSVIVKANLAVMIPVI